MKWWILFVVLGIIKANFGLKLNPHLTVHAYTSCDAGDDVCDLLCVFNTTSTNFTVRWEVNGVPVENASQDPMTKLHLFKSHVQLNDSVIGDVICIGYDGDASNANMMHTFPISGNQKKPVLLDNDYEIAGTGNCNVTFTCMYEAFPRGVVIWVKTYVEQYTVLSGYANFTVSEDNVTHVANLTIIDYSKNDTGYYTCIIYNPMGINNSDPMLPYVRPGLPNVLQQSVTFRPGDVVSLTCSSSGGFPAPHISWSYTGTERSNVNESIIAIDNGVSAAYLDIITNWNTDRTTVWCNIEDPITGERMKSDNVHFYITDIPYLVSANSCSVDDFKKNKSCMLACEVYSPTYVAVQWIYKFNPKSSDEYPLTNVSYPARRIFGGPFNDSLTLTVYWSGFYECHFMSSAGTVINKFQINNGTVLPAIKLGSSCTGNKPNSCGALNTVCSADQYHNCECPPNYPISSTNSMYASACLQEAAPYTLCINDEQCNAAEENYVCYRKYGNEQYGVCQCRQPYYKTYIHETDLWQCVLKVSYKGSCMYDGQCQLSDPFLYCDDSWCDCVDDYSRSNANYCQYDTGSSYIGISATAAIVVCVAILIVIIFIVTLIFIHTNSRNVRRRNRLPARQTHAQAPLQWPDQLPDLPPYIISEIIPPPSYHEAQRCETPPPSFDSIVDIKPTDGALVSETPTSRPPSYEQEQPAVGIFHIDGNVGGYVNPVYEDDC